MQGQSLPHLDHSTPQPILNRRVGPTNAFIPFGKDQIEQSIPARFEQQMHRYPDRLAVKTRHSACTYEALNQAANRVARAILAQRGEGEEPVALILEYDISIVATIFGVLKAGKMYVSLDPVLPTAQLTAMLEDAQVGLIVTNNQYVSLVSALAQNGRSWLNIDALDASLSTENPGLSIAPDTLCCIHYTSGSTGQPKGAVQNHRNVLHAMMNFTNDMHICANDRLTQLHSYSFSASLTHLYGALLNGAALLPFNLPKEGLMQLAPWLIEAGITVYYSGPSVFRNFIRTLSGEEQFPALRLIRLVGEPVTSRDVELYKKHFAAHCLFVNALGSAETLMYHQYCMDKATLVTGGIIPVGYACEDLEVLLLDETDAEVGVHDTGEIVVQSRYLSPGYWRQPALTDAVFRPDPAGSNARLYYTGDLGCRQQDGGLMYLGRKDSQVKVRGHRVEVAAVELALLEHPAINEVVVVARQDQPDTTRLVAYVVAHTQPAPLSSALRRFLMEKLPDYMVPSAFVTLAALPLTLNNKVDRQALPAPGRARPQLANSYTAPRTPIEMGLVQLWAEVLGLDEVGIHDVFLELGGDSLLATQIITRAINTWHIELPMHSLLEAPTVADMALVIAQRQVEEATPEDLDRILTELEALSDAQAEQQLSAQQAFPAGLRGEYNE